MDDREDLIRKRAYEIWEEKGRPTESALDFWLQAEREISANKEKEAGEEESGLPSP